MKYLTLILLLTVGTAQLHAQKPKEVHVRFMYDVFPGQETKKVRVICRLPLHIPKRQEVTDMQYSVLPDSIIHEKGNTYAVFLMPHPERQKITIDATVQIYKSDYRTTKRHRGEYAEAFPVDSIDYFLGPERFIETNDPAIQQVSSTLSAQADTLTTLWNIHGFVKEAFPYKRQQSHIGAARALMIKEGDCSEYADLFVAICRNNRIPARVVTGFVIKDDNEIGWHAWAEAYLYKYGWIPFDATGYRASFRSIDNKYVTLSRVINDKRLNYRSQFTYHYWGAPAKVLCATKAW